MELFEQASQGLQFHIAVITFVLTIAVAWVLRRRAKDASLPEPSAHRRAS